MWSREERLEQATIHVNSSWWTTVSWHPDHGMLPERKRDKVKSRWGGFKKQLYIYDFQHEQRVRFTRLYLWTITIWVLHLLNNNSRYSRDQHISHFSCLQEISVEILYRDTVYRNTIGLLYIWLDSPPSWGFSVFQHFSFERALLSPKEYHYHSVLLVWEQATLMKIFVQIFKKTVSSKYVPMSKARNTFIWLITYCQVVLLEDKVSLSCHQQC